MADRNHTACTVLVASMALAACSDSYHEEYERAAAACRNKAVEAGLNPDFSVSDAKRQQYWEDCMKASGVVDAAGNVKR